MLPDKNDQLKAIESHLDGLIFTGYTGESMFGQVCPAYIYPNVNAAIKAIIEAMDKCNDRDRDLLAIALLDHRIEPFAGRIVLLFPELAIDRPEKTPLS